MAKRYDFLFICIDACISAGDSSGAMIFKRLVQENPLTDAEWFCLVGTASDIIVSHVQPEDSQVNQVPLARKSAENLVRDCISPERKETSQSR